VITFGIWPGVVPSDLERLEDFVDAPPEDPGPTLEALKDLSAGTRRFYVRCYRSFGVTGRTPSRTPLRPEEYAGDGRSIDLVAGYGNGEPDPEGFARWIRLAVRDLHALDGGKLQVCEEVNVTTPPLDGARPGCYEALAAGLRAALGERDRLGADISVGFNCAGAGGDPFWGRIAQVVPMDVLRRVDYVGLDFFPDVFRPLPPDRLPAAVAGLVRSVRESARGAGLPDAAALHVTETGWPTGPDHSEQQQALTLAAVADAVLSRAAEVNLDTYEIFGLRDGLTSGPRMNRFGVLRDDHSAKPAWAELQRLIAAYGQPGPRQPRHSGAG
jgi:hypothetical protein